jgi:basic membrane protein A
MENLLWQSPSLFDRRDTTPQVDEIKRGSLTNRDGKDDKSFNASAYEGATEVQKKLGISLRYVEAGDDNTIEPLLRTFAQKDFDRIIDIGFVQEEPLVSGRPRKACRN